MTSVIEDEHHATRRGPTRNSKMRFDSPIQQVCRYSTLLVPACDKLITYPLQHRSRLGSHSRSADITLYDLSPAAYGNNTKTIGTFFEDSKWRVIISNISKRTSVQCDHPLVEHYNLQLPLESVQRVPHVTVSRHLGALFTRSLVRLDR